MHHQRVTPHPCIVLNVPNTSTLFSLSQHKLPRPVSAAITVVVVAILQFQLSGESNSIKYDVTPQFFDCGLNPYDRVVDKEFFINNTGKVFAGLPHRHSCVYLSEMCKVVYVGWVGGGALVPLHVSITKLRPAMPFQGMVARSARLISDTLPFIICR